MTDLLKRLPVPVALGASLYVLTRTPERLQSILSPAQIQQLITPVKYAFLANAVLQAVDYANSTLNWLAYNNYQLPDKSAWNWPEEIALVTGGSSGIGKGFALELAAKGLKVVTIDVNDAPSEITSNPRITHFKADLTDRDAVKTVAAEIRKKVGHPSILINNAGLASDKPILGSSEPNISKVIHVNLVCHWYTVQEFVPHMIEKRKGHVVTIASTSAFISMPNMSVYGATKAGAQVFHEVLASELLTLHKAPEIKMTLVHPSWIYTPMITNYVKTIKKAGMAIMKSEVVVDAVVNQIINCTSGKLVLGQGTSFIRRWRFYPHWITYGLLRLANRGRPPLVTEPTTGDAAL